MTVRVNIRKHEIGLWFRRGNFKAPLAPGVYWSPSNVVRPGLNAVEVFNTTDLWFTHPLRDVLVSEPSLREWIEVIGLTENQRAVWWRDGRLGGVLGPGRYTFWKRPAKVAFEVFEAKALRFEHASLAAVIEHPTASRWLEIAEVPDGSTGLLFVNGKLVETLERGRHAFWKGAGSVKVKVVDLREQVLDVAGQEIMTSDKVTLRVNLVVAFRITDAATSVTEVTDAPQALYREAQLALRAGIGTRRLDQLLSDKESAGNEVRAAIAARAAEFGIVVKSVGIKDIILPGEMKTILNRVIEAQKAAEAELIKRREETAAARSQANTAKLLAENPTLARLRELELLQGVLAGTKATFVFAPGDLGAQVRSLVGGSAAGVNAVSEA